MYHLTFQSSGDLIADRRYEYAMAYLGAGAFAEAADLLLQLTEMAPEWPTAWAARADAAEKAGELASAIEAWRTVLRLDTDDIHGARLHLARLGDMPVPEAPPETYVRALFDSYAGRFDAALLEKLGYRAPWIIAERLRAHAGDRMPFARGLDLGCGTGLVGEALAGEISWLDGVDISPQMIEQARRKGCYNSLHTGAIDVELARPGAQYDVVTAADVFVYMGDLGQTVRAVAARLVPGGFFAFTVEKTEEEPFVLRDSLRYAHGLSYLRDILTGSGLEIIDCSEVELRQDRGAPITGLAVLARRGAVLDADLPAVIAGQHVRGRSRRPA